MVWLRRLSWAVVVVHIGIALLHNAVGLQMSLLAVGANTTSQSRLLTNLGHISRALPLAGYARLTGIATGYGFYAPQVASPYVLEVIACSDTAEKPCDTVTRPSWAKGAGAVRYRAFTSSLRHLLPEKWQLYDTDTLDIRYTKVLVRQAAYYLAGNNQFVRWRVYTVRLAALRSTNPIHHTLLLDEPLAFPASSEELDYR